MLSKVKYKCKYADSSGNCSRREVVRAKSRNNQIVIVSEYIPVCPDDIRRDGNKVICIEVETENGELFSMGYDETRGENYAY